MKTPANDATRTDTPAAAEFVGALGVLAFPATGLAAMTAIGFGVAGHAFGLWMGAVAGAAEAAQRLVAADDADAPAADPVVRRTPSSRARAATNTLMADARSTADEVADAGMAERTKAPATPVAGIEAASEDAVADLMPEDFRPPLASAKPARPDDLKRIDGIGPKLETVLNGLGVWTFAQIAAWGREEIAWVDDYLAFSGRIARDGWIEQARALSTTRRRGKR